ncbi:elongator complex protein 4 [Adelges cooleyi]|uniref:elongator complex protein 4 n=1 Tax=Adelges cooleyi TaxID=133065 RepID=UPI00218090AA|nr:elongator complex protein 4 [Adelges cooleyi]
MSLLVLQAHTITQRKSLKLKGTKTSVTKNQILVSSGIISLDAVLDGGIPLGTIIFVEEEGHGRNADLILKHFIAEGVACDHSVLLASIELSPEQIMKDLPKPVQEDSDYKFDANEDLKIAWRYKQNPIIDSKPYQTSSSFGHIFDMSIKVPIDELENIKCWPNKNSSQNSYSALLEHINEIITKGGFSIKIPVEKRNILRITINHLCSPLWDTTDMDVITFVYKLRMLLRSSYATCLITTKIQIIDND